MENSYRFWIYQFIGSYPIAVSLDSYQRTMMNQTVNNGRSKGVVVIQDSTPITKGFVGGHYDRTTFIPIGDNLNASMVTGSFRKNYSCYSL